VNFDGDGTLDFVSGSYDLGEIYLFRGKGHGKLAASEVIKDRDGRPILKVHNQKASVESFGSWTALVDWDDDGDLDILVGTFEGLIFLRHNQGSRTKPVIDVLTCSPARWPITWVRAPSASAEWFLARSEAWRKSPLPAGEGARLYCHHCRANAKPGFADTLSVGPAKPWSGRLIWPLTTPGSLIDAPAQVAARPNRRCAAWLGRAGGG
jgi:hypothetical protein